MDQLGDIHKHSWTAKSNDFPTKENRQWATSVMNCLNETAYKLNAYEKNKYSIASKEWTKTSYYV